MPPPDRQSAERASSLGQRMDRLVERGEPVPVVRPARRFGKRAVQGDELLLQDLGQGKKAVDWRVVPPVAARSGPISSTLGRPPRGGQGI